MNLNIFNGQHRFKTITSKYEVNFFIWKLIGLSLVVEFPQFPCMMYLTITFYWLQKLF